MQVDEAFFWICTCSHAPCDTYVAIRPCIGITINGNSRLYGHHCRNRSHSGWKRGFCRRWNQFAHRGWWAMIDSVYTHICIRATTKVNAQWAVRSTMCLTLLSCLFVSWLLSRLLHQQTVSFAILQLLTSLGVNLVCFPLEERFHKTDHPAAYLAIYHHTRRNLIGMSLIGVALT